MASRDSKHCVVQDSYLLAEYMIISTNINEMNFIIQLIICTLKMNSVGGEESTRV